MNPKDIQPGMAVRFLNQVGGGKIIRISKPGFVFIVDENGFEYELSASEIIAVHSVSKPAIVQPKPISWEAENVSLQSEESNLSVEALMGVVKNGSMAFLYLRKPDFKLQTIEVCLVNKSGCEILYCISTKDGNQINHCSDGKLKNGEAGIMHSFQINGPFFPESYNIQAILIPRDKGEWVQPVNRTVPVNMLRLSEPEFYSQVKSSGYVVQSNVVFGEYREPVTDEQLEKLMKKYASDITIEKDPHRSVQTATSGKSRGGAVVFDFVVDLHIEELLDDYEGMSNGEIVEHQLAVFHKAMDKALMNHCRYMVFIHGIGNGFLRKKIREALTQYKGVKVSDGTPGRYGGGATEVTFL